MNAWLKCRHGGQRGHEEVVSLGTIPYEGSSSVMVRKRRTRTYMRGGVAAGAGPHRSVPSSRLGTLSSPAPQLKRRPQTGECQTKYSSHVAQTTNHYTYISHGRTIGVSYHEAVVVELRLINEGTGLGLIINPNMNRETECAGTYQQKRNAIRTALVRIVHYHFVAILLFDDLTPQKNTTNSRRLFPNRIIILHGQ